MLRESPNGSFTQMSEAGALLWWCWASGLGGWALRRADSYLPQAGGSWQVLDYLRPVEGPPVLAQTSKNEMLPAETVSLTGYPETLLQVLETLQSGSKCSYWNQLSQCAWRSVAGWYGREQPAKLASEVAGRKRNSLLLQAYSLPIAFPTGRA